MTQSSNIWTDIVQPCISSGVLWCEGPPAGCQRWAALKDGPLCGTVSTTAKWSSWGKATKQSYLKKALGKRRKKMVGDAGTSSGFSKHCHFGWVSSEGSNVFLHVLSLELANKKNHFSHTFSLKSTLFLGRSLLLWWICRNSKTIMIKRYSQWLLATWTQERAITWSRRPMLPGTWCDPGDRYNVDADEEEGDNIDNCEGSCTYYVITLGAPERPPLPPM